MDVFDAVRTILAVRRYKDQPVPVLWTTAAVILREAHRALSGR